LHEGVAGLEDELEAPRTAFVGCDSRTETKAAVVGVFVSMGAISVVGAAVVSGGVSGGVSRGVSAAMAEGTVIAGGLAGGVSYGMSLRKKTGLKGAMKR
jgi:hypothetical protein